MTNNADGGKAGEPSLDHRIGAIILRLGDRGLSGGEREALLGELHALEAQRSKSRKRQEQLAELEHLDELIGRTRVRLMNKGLPEEDRKKLVDRYDTLKAARRALREQVAYGAGSQINIFSGGTNVLHNDARSGEPAVSLASTSPEPAANLAARRQEFHFDFLKHSLKTSEVTFWLSVVVMTLGAIIVLTSSTLAVIRGGDQGARLVTGLTGALITTAGGVLHRHARQARSDVTRQADHIAAKVEEDDHFEKATAIIERVKDPKLKDQLKSTAALAQLGFTPDADQIANRLLPQEESPSPQITRRPDADETQ